MIGMRFASHENVGNWHIFTGLTGAEISLISGILQTISIKESVVGATSEVLCLGSRRGFFDPEQPLSQTD